MFGFGEIVRIWVIEPALFQCWDIDFNVKLNIVSTLTRSIKLECMTGVEEDGPRLERSSNLCGM